MSSWRAEEEVVKEIHKKVILEQKPWQFVNSCTVEKKKKLKNKDLIMLDSQSHVFPLPLLNFILESNFSISMMFLIYIHIWVAISLHSASLSVCWGHIIIYFSSVASLLVVWEIPMFYRKCKWYRIYFPFNLIFPDAAYHGCWLLSVAPFSLNS